MTTSNTNQSEDPFFAPAAPEEDPFLTPVQGEDGEINMLGVIDDIGYVELKDWMGSDLTVVNAARVSFGKESKKLCEADLRLMRYLATHDHWTPFAHPQITLRIKAPIFIRAQLGKSQVGLVMNEMSRRYVKDNPEFYLPRFRHGPTDGAKQGSSTFLSSEEIEQNDLVVKMQNHFKASAELYEWSMKVAQIAPEQARSVLPQSLYTEWWWTGSLMAFARVVRLRKDAHAQWECQQYAKAMEKLIRPRYPHSWNFLMAPDRFLDTTPTN